MKLIPLETAERQARDKKTKPRAIPNDVITEDSAALEFAARHFKQLRYCHDTAAWFKWSGNSWRVEKTGLAFEWARLLARSISEDADAKTRAIVNRTQFAGGVERFARSDRKLATTAEFWDRDAFILGTPGGTVDLLTGRLRPAEPEEGITKETAIVPASTADCPRWIQFLEDATGGDEGLIRFLQQWAGYSLTGDTREHALVFVYGPGGNGKSVFLNALTGILKGYATTAAMDAFTHSHGDKHPTDLAMLRGARLVTASETEEGRAWAEARIKALTGGDPITARFMRQDFFTFVPSFKLTVVGNHQPVLRNVDDAARRRFNIVPFVRKPETPDKRLEEKLKAEWPGILRWMIDGCLDWQKNGLVRPESVNAATNDYFSEQDTFRQWLDDECEIDLGNPHKWEATADLFDSWSSYAKAAGEDPGTKKSFVQPMQRHGLKKTRKGGARGWEGLRLKRQDYGHDR